MREQREDRSHSVFLMKQRTSTNLESDLYIPHQLNEKKDRHARQKKSELSKDEI